MELAIIGLPQSGKTTVFKALTRGKAQTAAYAPGTPATNIGAVKVPDPRLDGLTAMFRPKRTVPTEVSYIDVGAPPRGFGQLLSQLIRMDALIHLVRAFHDDRVPHIEGSVDPARDIATMNLELAFSDMSLIERRRGRIEESLKGAKQQEREIYLREQALLKQLRDALEHDVPIRAQSLSPEEAKTIENYQFLTAKPLLLLLNIGEGQLKEAAAIEGEWRARCQGPRIDLAALCGKLEMELGELNEADAQEFRASLGLAQSALDRVIRASSELLGLLTFFTVVSDEVKAWNLKKGTSALKAAGKIHSDMERGFIRAEVIALADLEKYGSLAEAKKRGMVRLEGKNYEVRDGDVITFLFNI